MNKVIDLRKNTDFDSIYFQAKSLRNDTRRLEREALLDETSNSNIVRNNWQALHDQANDILENHSIDVEACSWLVEAELRLNGIDGFITAWERVHKLIESQWPNVFPSPSDSETPHPFESLSSLNGEERDGTLIPALKNLPISDPENEPVVLFWQYQDKQNDPAINLTQTAFYQTQLKKIEIAKTTFENLIKLLKRLDEKNAPSSQNIIKALQDYQQVLQDILQRRGPQKIPTTEKMKAHSISKTDLTSRQLALQKIIEIADYFETHEPHSPLSALLKRCARWGELSLNELLSEMIRDQNARQTVCNLIGIENGK